MSFAFERAFMSFNLIYWTPICGKCFLEGSILEKCGKIWENGCFFRWLRPDLGNSAWLAMAGLGSIGLMLLAVHTLEDISTIQILQNKSLRSCLRIRYYIDVPTYI